MNRDFYCGNDTVVKELERKNKTGAMLIGGRDLHGLAIHGFRVHKKCVACDS